MNRVSAKYSSFEALDAPGIVWAAAKQLRLNHHHWDEVGVTYAYTCRSHTVDLKQNHDSNPVMRKVRPKYGHEIEG